MEEVMIPKSWIENLEVPSIICEYSAEQCEKMKEVKEDLACLANELGLVFRD